MLFKGTIGTQYSGSLAGVTASHNRGGAYLRQRAIPTNPNSIPQQAARSRFGISNVNWTAVLSASQREAWTLYGQNVPVTNRIGEQINLTGKAWYVAENVARALYDKPSVDNAPTDFTRAAPIGVDASETLISAETGIMALNFDEEAWGALDGAFVGLQVGNEVGPAINFYSSPFRIRTAVDGDSGTPITSTHAVSVADAAVLTKGNQLPIRVRLFLPDGRSSPAETLLVPIV